MSHIATVETNKLLEEVLYELQKIRLAIEDAKIEYYKVGMISHMQATTKKDRE